MKEETAGPMWFNLPATQITPEIEQDMKIMKMRNILDRKRHYKKSDSSALPKYFQVGWILKVNRPHSAHSRIFSFECLEMIQFSNGVHEVNSIFVSLP